MTERDKQQLLLEIEHVFDSGANHSRMLSTMIRFIESRDGVGSSYTLYQGTEFGVEKLDLLIIANSKLKKLTRIDLNDQTTIIIPTPTSGIPKHFKVITEDSFNELFEKYFS